jgi:hypothetical protein
MKYVGYAQPKTRMHAASPTPHACE